MGRSNGEGTYYPRRDGRWEGAKYFETVSGQRKRLRVYGKTKNEARQKLMKAEADAQRGILLADKVWSVSEYLDYWVEATAKKKRYGTYLQSERMSRLYLKPGLGKIPLTKLTVPLVQSFIDQQIASGHSVANVEAMRKVLSAALTSAMREELLARNVARLTVLPSYVPEEKQPWTVEEAWRFVGAAEKEPFYPAFLLLVFYGLRIGEVLGLQWQDIDLLGNTFRIRHQIQRGPEGLEIAPLKTKASKRPLPLIQFVRAALIEQRRRQNGTQTNSGLIFVNSAGAPLEASTVRRSFYRACHAYDVRRVKPHETRHGLATLLKDLGVPAKDAQVILGHARASTTQEIYQHSTAENSRTWLELVEEKLTTQKEKDDDRESHRLGDGGCRQFSRQVALIGGRLSAFNIGAGQGTLTPGLILGKDAL